MEDDEEALLPPPPELSLPSELRLPKGALRNALQKNSPYRSKKLRKCGKIP